MTAKKDRRMSESTPEPTAPAEAAPTITSPDGAVVWKAVAPAAVAKPKLKAKPKPKPKAVPKARAAIAPATDAELSASASKVVDGLKGIANEEWQGLKERGRGIAEIFLGAIEDGLAGRASGKKK